MEGIPVETKANAGAPHIIGSLPSSDDGSSKKRDHSLYAEEDRSQREVKQGGPFVDANLDQRRWKPLDSYEGSHRFDPDFEWDQAEEKKLVRKVRAFRANSVRRPTDLRRSTGEYARSSASRSSPYS